MIIPLQSFHSFRCKVSTHYGESFHSFLKRRWLNTRAMDKLPEKTLQEAAMANRRICMRSIKEILRLKYAHGLSNREIALSCGVSHTVINHYVLRARQKGMCWPLTGRYG